MGAQEVISRGDMGDLDLGDLTVLPVHVQKWIELVRHDADVRAALVGFERLRPYQAQAVMATVFRIRKTLEPLLITLPTGAGKSWVIAALASVVQRIATVNSGKQKKVLVLAHSKELVQQNYQKIVEAGYHATIYSSGLQQRDASGDIVFGSRQTIINALDEFAGMDYEFAFAAVFVDEAHSMPCQTREIIDGLRRINPNLRVIGLTATPYAMGKGYVFARDSYRNLPELREVYTRNPYFAERVFDKCVHELIAEGFLSPPILGTISDHYNTEGLERTAGGSFTEASNNAVFVTGQGNLTKRIVAEVKEKSKDRNGVMFFAQNREHARQVLSFLPAKKAALVDSGTKSADRDRYIAEFKKGNLKFLVTVSALAIGFDAPNVDTIAVLRHTESPSFFQQIVGRGLRKCDELGKRDCLILDFAQNLQEGGDLFTPAIQLGVPGDAPVVPILEIACPECDHENLFRKASWPADMEITKTGFLYYLDNGKLVVDNKDQPLAGHLGIQCGNLIEKSDQSLVRCGYTWGAVMCPRCQRRNSHRSDFCVACEEPLSKRAKLLTLATSRDENYTERMVRVVGKPKPWMVAGKSAKSGAPNLRVSLTVQELPYLAPDSGRKRKRDEDEAPREPWLPPGYVLVKPEPEPLMAWFNPTAPNAAAQASWATLKDYVAANQLKGSGVDWSAYSDVAALLDVLAEPHGALGFRAPGYLVFKKNVIRTKDGSDGGQERAFYNIVSLHKEHPEAEKINQKEPREAT